MRLFAGLLLVMAVITVVVLYGQEEEDLALVGRYDDVHRIRDNFTKETNQFVFTRLIYNGRIPGYYKNWYTDYPKGNRMVKHQSGSAGGNPLLRHCPPDHRIRNL